MPGQLKKAETTVSAKPTDEKPESAEKTKLENYLKARGAKATKVDVIFAKDHKDRKALADELREWCKNLPKAKM